MTLLFCVYYINLKRYPMRLLSIVWDVDPVIFSIGSISIRYYSLFFVVAFTISYLLFKGFFTKEGYKIELLDKLTFFYVIPATIIGARFGHCLFYEPAYYLKHPFEIILPFSNGKFVGYQGLASHGAAIGILLALYLFHRKYKQISFVWLLDRIGIAVAISGFWVRMGNLMNSEVYGVATNKPWGFVFVRAGETVAKHPTQIYEALCYLLIFVFLYTWYSFKRTSLKPGTLFGVFLILLFTARFFIEFIKEIQVNFEKGLTLDMGQWLSIPFILLGAGILVWSLTTKHPEKPIKTQAKPVGTKKKDKKK